MLAIMFCMPYTERESTLIVLVKRNTVSPTTKNVVYRVPGVLTTVQNVSADLRGIKHIKPLITVAAARRAARSRTLNAFVPAAVLL